MHIEQHERLEDAELVEWLVAVVLHFVGIQQLATVEVTAGEL